MVSYVDYAYYRDSFMGTAIPEESFARIAKDASAFIREITFNRIVPEKVPEEAKDAVCAVCETLYAEAERVRKNRGDTREMKSMNTDGESVSYVTESADGRSREEVMYEKQYTSARAYLIHTGLLYRGCY